MTAEASMAIALGVGKGTHTFRHERHSSWRKGRTGYAEMFIGNDEWVKSGWKNGELDTSHMFKRNDGKPQKRQLDLFDEVE